MSESPRKSKSRDFGHIDNFWLRTWLIINFLRLHFDAFFTTKRFHKFFLTLFSYIFVSSTRQTEKKCMKNFSSQSTLFYFFGIWKLYQATASVRFKQYILCVESVDNNFGFYGFSAGGARHVNKMIRGAELIEFSFWLWGSQKSQSSQLCVFWRRG